MDIHFLLQPTRTQMSVIVRDIATCNLTTEKYGLSLSPRQIQTLLESRSNALKNAGRVEFGQGVLKKLIYAFCDSPYLTQSNYEEALITLQDMFYCFKNESMDTISDDELIDAMKYVFNGKAHGSLECLSTSLEHLCHNVRDGLTYEDSEVDERYGVSADVEDYNE